nr:pilin N-terminal domain-containing protein [Corynebacterium ulceribovis]
MVVKPTGGNEFDNPQTIGQIADIEFTAQKLAGYDLTTAEGWKKARALTEKEAEKGPFDGDKVSARTDAEGKAYFQGLEVGLYLVKEVVPKNPQGAYKQSVPLLITLPVGFKGSTDDPNPRWDCRVEVNAKVNKPGTPPGTPEVPPKTPPNTPPKTPPSTPPQSTVPPTPSTPKDGTSNNGIRGVIARTGITAPSVFIGLGLLLIAALVLVLRRKKNADEGDA